MDSYKFFDDQAVGARILRGCWHAFVVLVSLECLLAITLAFTHRHDHAAWNQGFQVSRVIMRYQTYAFYVLAVCTLIYRLLAGRRSAA